MKKAPTLSFLVSVLLISCSAKNELIVDPSDPAIEYSGRINTSSGESAGLSWPGSSIRINFEGASIAALLQDESGDNYYNVILDNDSLFILRPQTIKQYQVLASNLSKGPHTIEIFRRTEWNKESTNFYGFKINANAKLLAKSPPKKRKIEFYGDSIT